MTGFEQPRSAFARRCEQILRPRVSEPATSFGAGGIGFVIRLGQRLLEGSALAV
jgi:hypothetical protein